MAQTTYLRQISGGLAEAKTIEVSSGTPANDASKIPNTNTSGVVDPTLLNAANTGGTGKENKMAQLDASGRLATTMMPVGVVPDTADIVTSEVIANGAFVNIFNSSGVKVRNADAATARPAFGFVPVGGAAGATVTVYFEGTNTAQSGRTVGAVQYLGAAGAPVETPPTASGSIVQQVGVAISTTGVSFEPHLPILLA